MDEGDTINHAGPSNIPPQPQPAQGRPLSLSGSTVGQLDHSQQSRLLSSPDAKLSFASFHPRAAGHSSRMTTQDVLCTSKRIVIETLANGESFWRWVPRARGVQSVEEEGRFPRVIEICGVFYSCDQEQWDIYKLDPAYDCFVQPAPMLTIISLKGKGKERATEQPVNGHTHARPDLEDEGEEPSHKRARHAYVAEADSNSDDDFDEVANMVNDSEREESPRKKWLPGAEARKRYHEQQAFGGSSGPSSTTAAQSDEIQDLSMLDLTIDDTPPPPPPPQTYTFHPPPSTEPTPAEPIPHWLKGAFPHERDSSPASSKAKRARQYQDSSPEPYRVKRARQDRSGSPDSPRKRRNRQSVREKYAERTKQARDERDKAFMKDIYADAASHFSQSSSSPGESQRASSSSQYTQESQTPFEDDPIAEKIRRVREIDEIEKAQAAIRLQQEREAQEAREAAERKQEEERLLAERKREEERLRAEREEKEREEARRLAREQRRRQKQQQHERWLYGPWTLHRALERYKIQSDVFDLGNFSDENPITFLDVPWPVLSRPSSYHAEDIEWSTVEKFFSAAREHMRHQDFKTFVEKSHRRFHPDRWRARRVLQSIEDEEERALFEVAANTVAQAITPIWRDIKG